MSSEVTQYRPEDVSVPASADGLNPGQRNEMVEMAKLMSKAAVSVPKHLQGNPGDCLAIVHQASKWGMDPFLVAQKTSVINGALMYEGQLVHAVLIHSGVLESRLRFDFSGQGQQRECTATGTIRGEDEPRSVTARMPGPKDAKNSPLWQTDPDQQLTYKAARVWARRHAPEVMLGVYVREDDWMPARGQTPQQNQTNPVDHINAQISGEPQTLEAEDIEPDQPAPDAEPEAAPAEAEPPPYDPDTGELLPAGDDDDPRQCSEDRLREMAAALGRSIQAAETPEELEQVVRRNAKLTGALASRAPHWHQTLIEDRIPARRQELGGDAEGEG